MELALLVYFISMLDGFALFLQWVFALAIIVLVGSGICYGGSYQLDEIYEFWNGTSASEHNPGNPGFKKIFYWIFPIIFFSIVFRLMIPSEKTAYVMVGAYAAQKIATHPNTQEIGGKVLTIINQKLEVYAHEGQQELDELLKKK